MNINRVIRLLLLLLLHSFSLFSSVADSLEHLLAKTNDDSTRFALLCKLSFEYRKTAAEKAIDYSYKAVALAVESGKKNWEAKALNMHGLAYYYNSDYEHAIENCENALRIATALHDSVSIAVSYNHLGNIYKALSNNELSIAYHKKCVAIREKQRPIDTMLLVQSYTNLGNSYNKNGQYEPALDNYNKAMVLLNHKRSVELANTYNGIANVFSNQKKQAQALQYYLKTYDIYKNFKNAGDESVVLKNIGSVYEENRNFKLAFDYYQQALTIREKQGNKFSIGEVKQALASLFTHSGEYDKALPYSLNAYQLDKELGIKTDIALDAVSLARIYFQLRQKDKTLSYTNEAIGLLSSFTNGTEKASIQREIARNLYDVGDFKRAVEFAQKAYDQNDSLHDLQTSEIISRMQTTFKVKDKEHEIELAQT